MMRLISKLVYKSDLYRYDSIYLINTHMINYKYQYDRYIRRKYNEYNIYFICVHYIYTHTP